MFQLFLRGAHTPRATVSYSALPVTMLEVPKETLWHYAYHNTYRKEEEPMLRVMAFVFPGKHCVWWKPTFLGMDEPLPAHEKRWIHSLFGSLVFYIHMGFAFKWSLIQVTSFHTFTLPFLFLILCMGSEWVAVWYLDVSHNIFSNHG